jgi:hypothetical protein
VNAGNGPARYDPVTGTLVAPADVIRAVATGRPARLLDEFGAVRDGVVHQQLAPTVAALRDPVHGTLQLAYQGRALDGWRGTDTVALLTPADPAGHHTLARVPAARLPQALTTVAALQERPHPPGPTTVAALRNAENVVRWWRLLHGPTELHPGGLLEVVDTTTGLFIVGHDDTAIPTDAPSVAHLIRWLCHGGPPHQPLRPLPPDVPLPEPAPLTVAIPTQRQPSSATPDQSPARAASVARAESSPAFAARSNQGSWDGQPTASPAPLAPSWLVAEGGGQRAPTPPMAQNPRDNGDRMNGR